MSKNPASHTVNTVIDGCILKSGCGVEGFENYSYKRFGIHTVKETLRAPLTKCMSCSVSCTHHGASHTKGMQYTKKLFVYLFLCLKVQILGLTEIFLGSSQLLRTFTTVNYRVYISLDLCQI